VNAAVERGKAIFAEQCASCHGTDGKGKQEQGAPNLTDAIWLYGDSRPAIVESIRTGRGGMMPAWAGRLDALDPYSHRAGAKLDDSHFLAAAGLSRIPKDSYP